MAPASWLGVLTTEIAMAPGFATELDRQLRAQAVASTGVDLAGGDYTLLPSGSRFGVQFRTIGNVAIGVIEGDLVDPSAHGHPVALGWRSKTAPDQPVEPDQEPSDLEFFWIEFPIAALLPGTRIDTSAAEASSAARFPIDWNVHQWSSVWVELRAHRAFSADELAALTTTIQEAVRAWNARAQNKIQYLGEAEISPERATVAWYLDLGAAGQDALVAVIKAVAVSPAAGAIARGSIGLRR